jgi:cytochrome b pre-mRNA-processing protein 3
MVIYGGRASCYQGCEENRNQPLRSTCKVFYYYGRQAGFTISKFFLDGLLPEPGYDGKYMILKQLFKGREKREKRLYGAIVAAARHVRFYEKMGVPDTIEGRFEMIVLHLFLVLNRLKGEGVEGLRQRLTDEFFSDMDRSLRELGVSDVTVGKKVRKIAESYYGRVIAYDKALLANADILQETIGRNIYPDGAPEGSANAMTDYFSNTVKQLGAIPLEKITQGELRFP